VLKGRLRENAHAAIIEDREWRPHWSKGAVADIAGIPMEADVEPAAHDLMKS
jgi:hypothetical protein